MKLAQLILRYTAAALFGLCATDGICQLRGIGWLTPLWENLAVGLFFAVILASLTLAWVSLDRKALARMRLWTGMVLGLSLGLLLVLWLALLGHAGKDVVEILVLVLGVTSTPVISCSVMFWPVFGYVLVLLLSHRALRELEREREG